MQLWGNDIATSWGRVIMEPFEWGLPAIQIDVSGFSMAKDSQTGKFALLWAVQNWKLFC